MEENYYKRSGQIPAFGNWDYTNDLPITQYFECARQAGLIRSHCSSSSGECGRPQPHVSAGLSEERHQRRRRHPGAAPLGVPPRKTRVREKRLAHVKEPEPRKQSRTCDGDVPEPPKEQRYVSRTGNNKNKIVKKLQEDDAGSVAYPQMAPRRRPPKPVDEDLYKISPDLLRTTKRKKMLGFISRCLAPACAA